MRALGLVLVLTGCMAELEAPRANQAADETFSVDGVALYASNCSTCHGPLETSAKLGATTVSIAGAIAAVPQMKHLSVLRAAQVDAIATALKRTKQPPVACATAPDVGTVPMHRLNQYEYRNTIRAVTGVALVEDTTFPTEETAEFANNARLLSLNAPQLRWYLDTAGQVAAAMFAAAPLRSRLFTCDLAQSACWQAAVSRFAERVYRRPLKSDELDRVKALYQAQLATSAPTQALQVTVQALLTTPQFLFRNVELADGESASPQRLDDYELATRISYFVWGESPDDALYAEAARGALRDPVVLGAQVDRLLADDRATSHLGRQFFSTWLNVDSLKNRTPDATRFPAFTAAIQADMATETRLVLEDLVKRNRTMRSLLDLDFTYASEGLAGYYGLQWPGGAGFQRVSLAGSRRTGVLTHGSVLTVTSHSASTSIVRRGSFVAGTLECATIESPPDGVAVTLPPNGAQSIRQRLEAHRANPQCASCHAVMDPPGFGLENFNAVGQFRTVDDEGFPLDTAGRLASGEAFNNANELATALAAGNDFKRCTVQKLMTFALGRTLERFDACTVQNIVNQTPNATVRDVVMGVIQSDAFQNERGG